MPNPFLIIAAAEAILIVILVALLAMKGRSDASEALPAAYPYQKEPSLLSPAERAFFGVLEDAVAGRYRIMTKVRMADVLQVQGGLPFAERQLATGPLSSRHIDFILCRPSDLRPEIAIEVDEGATNSNGRDEFVDEAMKAAGLPLLRLSARQAWRVTDLQATLKLGKIEDRMDVKPSEVFNPGPAPSCQVCGAPMVLRTIKHSDRTTELFWGCMNYPKCKAAQPIKEAESKPAAPGV